MEILSLKVRMTDKDLEPLTKLLAEGAEGVENLAVRFAPEGVLATGLYPTPFMKVSFETLWSVRPVGPDLRLKLETLKVAGIPGGFLRGLLVKMAKDAIDDQPGVKVEGEEIVVTMAEVAADVGINVTAQFTGVSLAAGTALIECSPATE